MPGKHAGYILEQLLISLLIVAFFVPVLLSNLHILSHLLENDPSLQDEITLAQMRHIMNCAMDISVSENAIVFQYHHETSEFYFSQDRILLKPGSQFFLTELSACSFQERNGVIYVSYERNEKSYTKAIGHQ